MSRDGSYIYSLKRLPEREKERHGTVCRCLPSHSSVRRVVRRTPPKRRPASPVTSPFSTLSLPGLHSPLSTLLPRSLFLQPLLGTCSLARCSTGAIGLYARSARVDLVSCMPLKMGNTSTSRWPSSKSICAHSRHGRSSKRPIRTTVRWDSSPHSNTRAFLTS